MALILLWKPHLSLISSQVLEPVVKAVANNFITERNNSDAIAMGCVLLHICNQVQKSKLILSAY